MKRTIRLLFALFVFLLIGSTSPALGQQQISQLGTEVLESFGDFRGNGFAPSPSSGQLDSDIFAVYGLSDGDLDFGGTETSGDFARGEDTGTKGVTTGGIYALEPTDGDYALGFQPGGSDLTPGVIYVCYQNDTGSTIESLDLAYNIGYYNDQERGSTLDLFYQTGSTCESPVAGDVPTNFTPTSLSFSGPEASDASPAWDTHSQSTTISSLSVAHGDFITLAFFTDDTGGGSGSRDEVAIDNLGVTAQGASGPVENLTQGTLHNTIQDALDNAVDGDEIFISNGTYIVDGQINGFESGVTLRGASESGVVIDATSVSGWALFIDEGNDNVTLKDFTILGGGDESIKVNFLTGLTVENVTAKGSAGNEIDLNNVTDATLTDFTAEGDGTAGVGIALTGVKNVTLDGVTTSGNNWGGVGIFDTNPSVSPPSGWTLISTPTNIEIVGSSFSEPVSVYTDNEFGGGIGDLILPNFDYTVENPDFRDGIDDRGEDFTFYKKIEQDAIDLAADGLASPSSSYIRTLTRDGNGVVNQADNFIVGISSSGTAMSIQAAVDAAGGGGGSAVAAKSSGPTITVMDGTYTGNVLISTPLALVSQNGRSTTTLQGVSGVGGLGAVVIDGGTNGVTLEGFTVQGIDNGNPGIENASVYLVGSQTGTTIKDNDIVAAGDAGLLTEYGGILDNVDITGNIFSGKTFLGSTPGGSGFGSQFSTPNVPRSLLYISNASAKTNISFTNNTVSGTAGGINAAGEEQGNTLVTIDAIGATISGNTFNGVTTRFGAALRARGTNTSITGNAFTGSGPRGIYLEGNSTSGLITVTENLITEYAVGVSTNGSAGSSQLPLDISQNCIISNDVFGLKNDGALTVDATNNWWGSAGGPEDPSVNGVNDPAKVDFDPYATTPISGIEGCGGSGGGQCDVPTLAGEVVDESNRTVSNTIVDQDGIVEFEFTQLTNFTVDNIDPSGIFTQNGDVWTLNAGEDPPTEIDYTLLAGQESSATYFIKITDACEDPGPQTAELDPQFDFGEATPAVFALGNNYPNPFSDATTIHFTLPESTPATLNIYDLMGRKVATLINGHHTAGTHEIRWDGRDDGGARLASGLYLVRLKAGERVQTSRLTIVR